MSLLNADQVSSLLSYPVKSINGLKESSRGTEQYVDSDTAISLLSTTDDGKTTTIEYKLRVIGRNKIQLLERTNDNETTSDGFSPAKTVQ